MRHYKQIILTLILGLSINSCTNVEQDYVISLNQMTSKTSDNSHVSMSDVLALIGSTRPTTRSAEDEEYIPILDNNNGDTIFYVVNYPEGGWTMYATDKRVPAVVAECETGRFNLMETERMMGTWFEAMKEDMKIVRQSADSELNFTAEEIQSNIDSWNAVCDIQSFVREHDVEYIGIGLIPHGNGYFTLYKTEVDTVFYDSINHLTTTKWNQNIPYNNYCPDKYGQSGKAPAGCVAIAGAQMLFYLHYKLGIPAATVDSASCTGNIYNYVMNQWGNSTSIWNRMKNDSTYSAPLIAYVGKNVNMQYGNNSSGAYNEDLVNGVFYPNGISCQYQEYDFNDLSSSLLNGMPVIAAAFRWDGSQYYGHSFIIDGYKRKRVRTSYYYSWHSNLTPANPNIIILWKDKVEHYYGTPEINEIKMNWGWGYSAYQNAPWVAPTGDWLVNGKNYLYYRSMIHNFNAM